MDVSTAGGVSMDETIGLVKQQAYHRGYLDGYKRGLEDSCSGKAGNQPDAAMLDRPIQFLNLSTRPFNSLDRAGYRTIRDVVSLTKTEIRKIRSLGSKGLCEIAGALWDHGIRDSEWNEWLYSD
jgi:DNA-directed RNA polymerase alpha subunit